MNVNVHGVHLGHERIEGGPNLKTDECPIRTANIQIYE